MKLSIITPMHLGKLNSILFCYYTQYAYFVANTGNISIFAANTTAKAKKKNSSPGNSPIQYLRTLVLTNFLPLWVKSFEIQKVKFLLFYISQG